MLMNIKFEIVLPFYKSKYHIIKKATVFFPKFISRSDVAKFFVDCLSDTSFDGKAVLIEGA